jgi:prepilin-type N-terminal cleavage/methylation domain-containing protein
VLSTARLRSEGGFTLIELVSAMAVFSILIAAFAQLLGTTVIRSGRTQEQSTLQTEVRAGVDALASDLRQALCNDTTPPVTAASPSQITFYSPDRLTPYHLRQVSYRVSGGSFQRAFATSTNTGGPPWTMPALGGWSTLSGSITNASPFTYFDATNVVTATAANVARVDITLSAIPAGATGSDGLTTYTSSVDLRTPTCNS